MNYQSWPERQDIRTIDDARTNKFKFSFAPRTIRDWNNKPHNVVEIADDANISSANYCCLRFSRNPLTRDVNNIIHLMNMYKVTTNK